MIRPQIQHEQDVQNHLALSGAQSIVADSTEFLEWPAGYQSRSVRTVSPSYASSTRGGSISTDGGMRHLVADVDDVGLPRLDLGDHVERLTQLRCVGCGRARSALMISTSASRIRSSDSGGDPLGIGDVDERPETESLHDPAAVGHRDRHNLTPKDLERPVEDVEHQVRLATVERKHVLKGVRVAIAQQLGGLRVGEDRQMRLIQLVEAPQVVDSGYVVGVGVGVEDGVDLADACRTACDLSSGEVSMRIDLPSNRTTADVRPR